MWKATCVVIALFFVLALTQVEAHENHHHALQKSLIKLDSNEAGQNRLIDEPDLPPTDPIERKHKHPKRHTHKNKEDVLLSFHKGLDGKKTKNLDGEQQHESNPKHAHKRHAHAHKRQVLQYDERRQVIKPHKKQGKSKAHVQSKHEAKRLHKSGATQHEHGKKQHDQRWKQ